MSYLQFPHFSDCLILTANVPTLSNFYRGYHFTDLYLLLQTGDHEF